MAGNPFDYGRVSYENQRGVNPYGYGYTNYGMPRPAKPDPSKAPFAKGELVLWTKKQLHAKVIDDWKDYGLQIEVEDERGVVTRHRVARDDVQRGITVLDILSRI